MRFQLLTTRPGHHRPVRRERLLNATHLVLRQQILPEVAGCGSHVGGCDRRRVICVGLVRKQLVPPTAGSPALRNAGRSSPLLFSLSLSLSALYFLDPRLCICMAAPPHPQVTQPQSYSPMGKSS